MPSRLRLTIAAAAALLAGPMSLAPTGAQASDVASGDTVIGEVVRAWAEPRTEVVAGQSPYGGPLTWIRPDVGTAVRVPTDQAAELPLGATVEVTLGGEVVDAAAAVGGVEPAREVWSAGVVAPPAQLTPPPLVGPAARNELTVALVVPAGETQDGTTLSEVVSAVNRASSFWYSQTQLQILPTVAKSHDWMSATASCDEPTQLWDEVASAVGFVGGPGKRLVLYLPEQSPLSDCPLGLAEIGSGPRDSSRLSVRDTSTSVVAHALGHAFGLGHSSTLVCDAGVETGSCQRDEYGDLYDVMGASWEQLGSLSTLHRDQLGFLSANYQASFDANGLGGRVTLSPLGRTLGVLGVRLVSRSGDEYWLEYRAPVGQDIWLTPGTGTNTRDLGIGVLVRSAGDMPNRSLLLDAAPAASSLWDDSKQVAREWRAVSVAQGDFTVTVEAVSSTGATVRVGTRASADYPRDWTGDDRADVLAVDRAGTLQLYPGSGTGGFLPRRAIGTGWASRDLITMVGDWDADGRPDMVARNPANGDLWLYRGNDAGGFSAWRVIGRGWQVMTALFSPGDWTGDGYPDLIARVRDPRGPLVLYASDGYGGINNHGVLGTGWNSMTAFVATGDWDRNGVMDFAARHSDGTLYLYSDEPGEAWFAGRRKVIGRGWNIFNSIIGPGDWNGDGIHDLLARKTDGTLWLYPGNGSGGFRASQKIGAGWTGFRLAS